MRSLLCGLLDELLFPLLKVVNPGHRHRLAPYRPATEACDLRALRELPPPAQVEVRANGTAGGARAYGFRFESGVPCEDPENRMVTGRLLEVDERAPWVVIVPGYATGAFRSGYGPFERTHAQAVLRRGINAALIDLPYHVGRRRPGTFSGEPFFSADLNRTAQALMQAAADTQALVRWLSTRAPVGLWGTSLGGCVGGLTAVICDRLEAVVLMEPLDNAGDVLGHGRFARDVRQTLAEAGVSPQEITRSLASVAPSRYQPAVAKERLLFLIPAYDRIIPVSLQERFWRSWGEPKRVVLRHGHVTAVSNRGAAQAAVAFLANWLLPRAQ